MVAGRVEVDVDETVDQVELDAADRPVRRERTPDERGFVRAVHPMHVQPNLGHPPIIGSLGECVCQLPVISYQFKGIGAVRRNARDCCDMAKVATMVE